MKILILGSKEYPLGSGKGFDPIPSGGIERYVENLIGEFTKYPDVETIVVTRKFPGDLCFQEVENINIYRVGWFRGVFLRNPTFNLNSFLLSLFVKFDLILCVGVVASLFGVILSLLKGVPIVHHFAGMHHKETQYNYFVKRVLYLLEVLAYRFRGDMIFLSEQNQRDFRLAMRFLPKRAHVIPTGIDVKHFSPLPIANWKPPLGLLAVGRLVKVKGIQDLLEALSKLKNELEFVCLILGDGSYRGSLEKITEYHSLKERVVFKGNVSSDEVINFLREASIFVLPSYAEGLPQSLLEAMACGLPCIVTDIGLPIKHGETGLVVSPSDVNGLVRAILNLSANPSLMETLGQNAREYIIKNHRRDQWGEKIYQLCRTVTDKKRPSRGIEACLEEECQIKKQL